MNTKYAHLIYDILVDECGANPEQRQAFVIAQTTYWPSEYRFGGCLGSGGKFWNSGGNWYINCYKEDENREVNRRIDLANRRLTDLKLEYDALATS